MIWPHPGLRYKLSGFWVSLLQIRFLKLNLPRKGSNTLVRFHQRMAFGTIAVRIAANFVRGRRNDKFYIASLWSSYELFLISCLFQGDKHDIGGKFSAKEIVIHFPQWKKNTHLSMLNIRTQPAFCFIVFLTNLSVIWGNLVYSIGTCVKVCKIWGPLYYRGKWALHPAVTWPQITLREQIAIFSLACSKCKFFSIYFSFWQCSCKRLCWFF